MTLNSDRAKRASRARETPDVFTILLDFEHPTFQFPFRLAHNTEPVLSNGKVYKAFPFRLRLPSETDRSPEARLQIANVDQEIGKILDGITTPIDVTMTLVLAETPDIIERTWSGFRFRDVRWNAVFAEGILTQRQFDREIWPPRRLTETHGFPWLARRK